jgi:hypothetical protein
VHSQCPLWSKNGQTQVRLDCPLSAISDIASLVQTNEEAANSGGLKDQSEEALT